MSNPIPPFDAGDPATAATPPEEFTYPVLTENERRLTHEVSSLKIDLMDRDRELASIRQMLGLGPHATEVEVCNIVSRLKAAVVNIRRKARLAGVKLR